MGWARPLRPIDLGRHTDSMKLVLRHDLSWAGFILGVGMLIGLINHWPLVRQSWQGDLTSRLEQIREQRRQEQFQDVKTINLAQAFALFQDGRALFIDSRPPEEFAALQIPKSRNISLSMLEQGGAEKLADIAKDREIVVYCSQESCDLALKVAKKLHSLGFVRAVAYVGGFRAWDEAGYPADIGN